jgi:Biopterin-dependent aromatic amino acid hydroxylase
MRAECKSNLNVTFDHQLPHVEYSEEEVKTWGIIFNNLVKLYPTHGECLGKDFLGTFLANMFPRSLS